MAGAGFTTIAEGNTELQPYRQRQIAWQILVSPPLSEKPTELARYLGCTAVEAKLALSKLRKRLGGRIDFERLCPLCLTHTSAQGVCFKCGCESVHGGYSNAGHGYASDWIGDVDNGYFPTMPIKLGVQARSYLRGNAKKRLLPFCLSRLDNLMKRFPSVDPYVRQHVAMTTKDEVHRFLDSAEESDRVERLDRICIVARVLLTCLRDLPQFARLWMEALAQLLTFPEVVLYGG
jgi:hypothetical protein